jgi:hypothetical protein
MRYSLAPKVFLALMLALTLSLKVIVRDTANEKPPSSLHDSVVAFLTRHQFQSHGTPDGSRIYASSGNCRLAMRQVDPQGYNLDAIKTIDAKEGQLSFVFKGLVYTDQPLASTILSHYWFRLQQKLGLHPRWNPVLAVVSSDSCSMDALPWKEVAQLS